MHNFMAKKFPFPLSNWNKIAKEKFHFLDFIGPKSSDENTQVLGVGLGFEV